MKIRKILFVCTGNSCRSQIAEGWAKELSKTFLSHQFCIASAGLEAHGLNPRAVQVMALSGIDISRHCSSILTDLLVAQADVVVTVCSHADQFCPTLPRGKRKIHLPFDDPSLATGSDDQIMAAFSRTSELIKVAITNLLTTLAGELDVQDKAGFSENDVTVVSRERLIEGFIPIDALTLHHRLFAGGRSETLRRELAIRGGAVGVILYDPVLQQLVLVRQFRCGMLGTGQSPWMLEIVAGMVAAGEATIDVVKREALEETNCDISDIFPIGDYFNSPGWSNERISLFCARVNAASAAGVHGLDEEHEDIRVEVVPLDQAIDAVNSGLINNATAMIAIQWLASSHEFVRVQWNIEDKAQKFSSGLG